MKVDPRRLAGAIFALALVCVVDSGWEIHSDAVVCMDEEGQDCSFGPHLPGSRDVLVLLDGADPAKEDLREFAFDWAARMPSSWQPVRLVQVSSTDLSRSYRRARRLVGDFEPELVIWAVPESRAPSAPLVSPARWGELSYGWLVWPWKRDEKGKLQTIAVEEEGEFLRRVRIAAGERAPEAVLPEMDSFSLAQIDGKLDVDFEFDLHEIYRRRLKLSEILGANGFSNTDVSRYPARAFGERAEEWSQAGGLGVGKGVWRASADLLGALRETLNARIRAIGPLSAWRSSMGESTSVVLFDADKNHPEHPTQAYEIEVRWLQKSWKACVIGFAPYPCADAQRLTLRKKVLPVRRMASISRGALQEAPPAVTRWFCAIGFDTACALTGHRTPASAQRAGAIRLAVPYEVVELPLTEWFTTYEWRFRTQNEFGESPYTEWTPIERIR